MNDIAENGQGSTSITEESVPKAFVHLGGIAAITRCILAKRGVRSDVVAEGGSSYRAKRESVKAYLLAMPPLSDLDNIRDFIACVTYGIATEVILPKDSLPLLQGAKAALVALRPQPEIPGLRAA